MIDGIFELPSSLIEGDILVNRRNALTMTDNSFKCEYVEVSIGRDISVFQSIHKYKAIRFYNGDVYEYIFMTSEYIDLRTLRDTAGNFVPMYPLLVKRLCRNKHDRAVQTYMYTASIQRLFKEQNLICAGENHAYQDSVCSYLDYVTMWSSKTFQVPLESLINPQYEYDIQPISGGEVVNMINYLTVADTSDTYCFMHEIGEIVTRAPTPTILIDHAAVYRNEFDNFTRAFGRFTSTGHLLPHLSPKYGMQLWGMDVRYMRPDVCRAVANRIFMGNYDEEDIGTPSDIDLVVSDAIGAGCTSFEMHMNGDAYRRTAHTTYYGEMQTYVPKFYAAIHSYKTLSNDEHAPFAIDATKTEYDELWCKFSPSGSMIYIDLVWWLLATGDLVNIKMCPTYNLNGTQYNFQSWLTLKSITEQYAASMDYY